MSAKPGRVAMPPPASYPSYATAPTPSASGIVSTPAPLPPSYARGQPEFNAASARALADADGNIYSGIQGVDDVMGSTEASNGIKGKGKEVEDEVVGVPEITAVQGIVPTLQ
jgi:hypothetical protein